MRTRKLLILLLLFIPATISLAQDSKPVPDVFQYNQKLGRGINLGNALDGPSEGAWGLTLKAEYFEAIQKAGFDSVRIPVRWSTHAGPAPDFAIDPNYLKRVDWAIDQALSRGLVAVLNIHHDEASKEEPARNFPRVAAYWRQIATRYKDRPDRLFFELLNEPNAELTDERWQESYPTLLAAIRESNPTRVVIVGPGSWNSLDHFNKLTLPESDRMLIATFHYYSPFKFTHQNAEWMPESKPWKGTTWTASSTEVEAIRKDFARAAKWGKDHHRPIYLGEFGAYSQADMESRARWTAAIAREAEKLGFSWCYWEFGSGFGAYDPATSTWHKPLLDALIPPRGKEESR